MIIFTEEFKIYVLPWISLSVTLYITWYVYTNILCAIHDKIKARRIIHKKQKEREHAFQKLENRYKLDAKSEQILQLPLDQLLTELRKRKLTAIEVLDAFMAKALKETKEYNSVTEFVPQAHIWAAQLDDLKDVKGPLHGLPISVKDNCNIEGMDSTLGFAKYLYKPEIENANLIASLKDLGAIVFCKTNVPQSLFCWGSGNPIFGETRNPFNRLLSPGGSSGGEASLIASGGSALGIGTDIGGSCRIPAHMCGVSGFKPTKMRLSPVGFKSTVSGVVGLSGGPGIISKSAGLIAAVFKELTMPGVQNKYDRLTVPITWDEKTFTSAKPLRIGYYTSLKFFPAIGDTEKVVLDAKAALEAEGHILVPFEMGDGFDVAELVSDFAYADDGYNSLKIWKDEPIAQSAIFHYVMCRIPRCVRRFLAFIMSCKCLPTFYFYSTRVAAFFRGGATKSRQLWISMEKRRQILEDVLAQWHRLNLDLVLCPTFPFASVPIKAAGKLKPACIYTMIWNLLDFPAGSVSFGTESGTKVDSYDNEDDFLLKTAQKATKSSTGMPIGVQVVGLPFQEEVVLRAMKELEYLRSIK